MPCHQPPLPPPPSWNRGRARGGGGDSPPAPFHGSISFGYPTTSKPKPPKQSRPPTHVIAPFSTPLNIRCLALFEEKAHTSDIFTRNHTHCSTYTLVSDYQGSVFVEKEHDSPSQEPPAGLADFGMVASTVCVRPVVHTRDPRWPGGGTPPPPVAKGSR